MDLSRFFEFDESIRVWVEKAHQPFDYSDGEEQERYILDALRNSTDVSTRSVELFGRMVDWPSTYHLTPRRGNLLRPFKSWFAGKRILEIGCGCGAITRFLGEAGATVVSVEGSLIRATIARERCRDLDNVEIICATSEKIDLLGEFDGVMLIGVLEYARKFLGENGTRRLLTDCAARLREGGHLFVAIENQLGLKYFAGAAEDHTGEPMLGIEERYSPLGVATFGREELSGHLAAAGFEHQQWWYPFPDYKLPLSVFSEDAASGRLDADFGPMIASASSADPQRPFYQVFSPERAWMPVYRNGLASALSNSFLAIVSRSTVAVADPALVASHYSVERLPEFAKGLEIRKADDGNLVVHHARLYPDQLPSAPSNVQMLPVDDAPFYAGEHWQHRLSQLLSAPGWSTETFIVWYERWLQALKAKLGMGASDPLPALDTPIDARLVDGLPRNLIVGDDEARFFDLEWKLGQSIELGYLLFRGAYCSLWELRSVAAPVEGTPLRFRALFEAALARASVTFSDEALERFACMERDFQQSTAKRSSVDRKEVFDAELTVAPMPVTEVVRLNEQTARTDEALKVQGTEIHRLNQLLNDKGAIFDDMGSQIRQLNERMVNEVGEKDRVIGELGGEIHRLHGVLEAKDSQIAAHMREVDAGEMARLRACIEEKDAELSRHGELRVRSEEALTAASKALEVSNNLVAMQANAIRELEQTAQAGRTDDVRERSERDRVRAELAHLYDARDALARTKWFRLRDALTRRPLSARQLARAAYLIGAISTPGLVKRPLARVVSQARALISPPPDPVVPQLPAAPVARKGSGANSYIVRQNKPNLAQRPRVLHVIANFMTGGSSKLVVDLIEGIGHRFQQTILTSYIPTPEAYTGVDIHEIPQPGEADEFVAFIRAKAPDFIHVHYWGDCDEPWYAKAFAAAEALGIPVVQNINTPVAPFLSQSIVRNVYVSQYVEREFGVPGAPNCVIYPGSDFSLFSLKEGEQPSGTRVGMVYRLERDKLNESAIVPFIRAAQTNPKARILIVGGGSLLEPFKASVTQAGVSEQFEFTGYVSYDELPNLYRQMAVFVAPVWKESFGQVSPFAMNMQVPVVGYDVGAIGEIVNDKKYLAPAGDAEELGRVINQLLRNTEERNRLALAHQHRAQQHFSLQAMVSAYRALYDDVPHSLVTRYSSSPSS